MTSLEAVVALVLSLFSVGLASGITAYQLGHAHGRLRELDRQPPTTCEEAESA